MQRVVVLGSGGFVGHHLTKSLVKQGYYVIGADQKQPRYEVSAAHEFHVVDLRDRNVVRRLLQPNVSRVYQLAADMGGVDYILNGKNDARILHTSAQINLNVVEAMHDAGIRRVLFTSSACMYPEHNQLDPGNPLCTEASAYPANPDSEYGWEKLFAERLYLAWARNYGLEPRIVRIHNTFGPLGSWNNGKEKAPAALSRKVAMAEDGGEIEVIGPGVQTRSFLYIDECVEGMNAVMNSDTTEPMNVGSTRLISINDLALLIAKIAGKNIRIKNVPGVVGVMGRVSDNTLVTDRTGWQPRDDLEAGLRATYTWVAEQVKAGKQDV